MPNQLPVLLLIRAGQHPSPSPISSTLPQEHLNPPTNLVLSMTEAQPGHKHKSKTVKRSMCDGQKHTFRSPTRSHQNGQKLYLSDSVTSISQNYPVHLQHKPPNPLRRSRRLWHRLIISLRPQNSVSIGPSL